MTATMQHVAKLEVTSVNRPTESRAVTGEIKAGSEVLCAHCGERVKFQAKKRNKQVICNVYVRGKWNRVEHFHESCYKAASHPHGKAVRGSADDSRHQEAIAEAAKRAKMLAREANEAS